ncbi:hypothetical protein, conserved [Babesia bigemina]|uniref:Uncharacterized protein n=1 Tax=Babesia bigemina TaxID=5866 RepID=A0A061D9U3_BABBI|nr:hypothetical protein, conserved [Babesia bigemina]CDR95684.1 hypothetical protein, conserved [Babesia bigemina]|eukprot:XP_012767870.1 hypothetical protein, conserved [Babesia bigemina]
MRAPLPTAPLTQSLFCLARRWVRHWAKKRHVQSTHYSIGDADSALYRQVVPGDILANRRRLPNRKLRPREFRLAACANGGFRLRAPYPPNVNVTLAPYPRNVAGVQSDRQKMGHIEFPQQYKGVKYVTLKRPVPYPRGSGAYGFDVNRILIPLMPSLLQRTGLLRPLDVWKHVHESATSVSMEVAGHFGRAAPPSADWRARVVPESASSTEDGSARATSALCYQVSEGKADIQALFRRVEFIASNVRSFSVNEVMLLCHVLASHAVSYSTWFRVNCAELTVLTTTCHRHLLANVATMTIEQLHCCLVLFEVMAARYPIFRLEYGRFQQLVMGRLCAASSADAFANDALSVPPPRDDGSSEVAVRKLSSKVQRVYRRVFPYFEAVNIRHGASRANTAHLVEAAACIQRQHASSAFQWGPFNALCANMKQLLRNAELFSLQSTMDFVALLHRNASMSKDAVRLDAEQVHVLAKKLAELNVDSYMVIPKEDGELPLPELVDQCVTKLFAVCLETPPLMCLTDCLLALIENGMLNDHLKLLLLPYVSSCILHHRNRVDDLLLLVPHRWLQPPHWLPFWVVYTSALLSSPRHQNGANIKFLSLMCDAISSYLSGLSTGISGNHAGTASGQPATGPCSAIGTTDEEPSSAAAPHSDALNGVSQGYRWLGQLDEVSLLNITDTEDLDCTSSLPALLEKRFGVPPHQEGVLGGFVASLSALQEVVGTVVQRGSGPADQTSATPSHKQGSRKDDNPGVSLQSSQNGNKNAEKHYAGRLMPDRNVKETDTISLHRGTQPGVASTQAQMALGGADDTRFEPSIASDESAGSLYELRRAHDILCLRISILQRQLDSIV